MSEEEIFIPEPLPNPRSKDGAYLLELNKGDGVWVPSINNLTVQREGFKDLMRGLGVRGWADKVWEYRIAPELLDKVEFGCLDCGLVEGSCICGDGFKRKDES